MAQALIELKDTVKWLGPNKVLDGVNLRIYRGQITSIIGQSGVGKSVLLKHIIGLLEPDSGQVLFEGKALAEMKKIERKALKRRFSYVFQDTALFDFLTVFGSRISYCAPRFSELDQGRWSAHQTKQFVDRSPGLLPRPPAFSFLRKAGTGIDYQSYADPADAAFPEPAA